MFLELAFQREQIEELRKKNDVLQSLITKSEKHRREAEDKAFQCEMQVKQSQQTIQNLTYQVQQYKSKLGDEGFLHYNSSLY